MRSILLIICTMSLYLNVQAQLHDKNWVFGTNNIVSFIEDTIIVNYIDSNAPIDYYYLSENVGCISDSLGNLVFYNNDLEVINIGDTLRQVIFNNRKEINYQESSFISAYTTTNGTIILPLDSANYLYLFLSSNESYFTSLSGTLSLKYHWIELKNNEWQYKKYAKDLFKDFYLSERLKAIKHPNGKDWWVIVQESLDSACSNKIASILLRQDSVIKINAYEGINRCNPLSFIGEIAITKNGDKVAMAYLNDSIEVFDFDRCTGLFGNSKLYRLNNQNLKAYGLEFSPSGELLYINSKNRNDALYGKLQQIKLSDGLITDVSQYIFESYQMELGPDDKLYFGFGGDFYIDSIYYTDARGFLHCIESPDSAGLACNLNFAKVKLNNPYFNYGLPNFPNYRLSSLSIFEAEAGNNAVICTDDSAAQKIVGLGSPKINGVIYQWYPNYNLSSDTTAQPLAFPDSSTWYYVTLTDTTIQDACQSRTDSVLVEVRRCNTSLTPLPELASGGQGVRLYPNPAREEITIEIHPDSYRDKNKIQDVKVYDVTGREINNIPLQLPLKKGESVVSLNLNGLGAGLYFIEVSLSNGSVERVKLVKQ